MNKLSSIVNWVQTGHVTAIRYDTRCYFDVRSKADISQLNLPHGSETAKSNDPDCSDLLALNPIIVKKT